MLVTLTGIGISILNKGEGHHLNLSLPLKGILLGVGAGIGQGVGLVLSKVGMEYYAAAIPADAPEIAGDMLPVRVDHDQGDNRRDRLLLPPDPTEGPRQP